MLFFFQRKMQPLSRERLKLKERRPMNCLTTQAGSCAMTQAVDSDLLLRKSKSKAKNSC